MLGLGARSPGDRAFFLLVMRGPARSSVNCSLPRRNVLGVGEEERGARCSVVQGGTREDVPPRPARPVRITLPRVVYYVGWP